MITSNIHTAIHTPSSQMVHESLFLYKSGDIYYFEPCRNIPSTTQSDTILTFNRTSGSVDIVSSLPTSLPKQQHKVIYGIIGAIPLKSGYQLMVITGRKRVASIGPHMIWQVTNTVVLPCIKNDTESIAFSSNEFKFIKLLDQFLNNTKLYFSYSFDLTRTLQLQSTTLHESNLHFSNCRESFFSNYFAQTPFISAFRSHPELELFVLPLIEGFVGQIQSSLHFKNIKDPGYPIQLFVISRRQWGRCGTRFHSRGIDEHGYVSNGVETEQIILFKEEIISFVQYRGSIPLFWRQMVNLAYSPSVEIAPISKSRDEFNTFDAMKKHFHRLESDLGNHIVAVNLVGSKRSEGRLEKEFHYFLNRIDETEPPRIRYIHFDFHGHCGTSNWENLKYLIQDIQSDLDNIGYFAAKCTFGQKCQTISNQKGVIRSNCVDCLDRTNVVQALISKFVLNKALQEWRLLSHGDNVIHHQNLNHAFQNLWADHADVLSLQYAGTGAQKTDFTRTGKRTLKGMFRDLEKSALRYIKNNFMDGTRQDSMDLFYGKFLANDSSINDSKFFYRPWYFKIEFYVISIILGMIAIIVSYIGNEKYPILFYFGLFLILFTFQQLRRYRYHVVSLPILVNEYVDRYGRLVPYEKHPHHIDNI